MTNNGRTIEVRIDPHGNSSIETKGFSGRDCLEASRFLEQAVGTKIHDSLTPEYHHSAVRAEQANKA